MDERPARLAARVRAINKANAYAIELYGQLAAVFAPLVGKEIQKNGGDLLAKVAKLMPVLPNRHDLMVYYHRSNFSLGWTVKTCEMIEGTHTCTYHETTVYIGELDGHTLTKLCDPFTARTDYSEAEVRANRKAYEDAKKIADDLHSKLYPFGEYDR
jgi:hypothetical protein